jgi:DNA adenine methylase
MDYALINLWTQVRDYPEQLKEKIAHFTPTVESFFRAREAVDGFSKLVSHQLSFSGLGCKARGPIGGRTQAGVEKIGARWNPIALCSKVDAIHRAMMEVDVRLTSLDYSEVLQNVTSESFVYLDPPYYCGGRGVTYVHDFTPDMHTELATYVHKLHTPWLLSYRDCSEIRGLYPNCSIKYIDFQHTVTVTKKVCELLIQPKS